MFITWQQHQPHHPHPPHPTQFRNICKANNMSLQYLELVPYSFINSKLDLLSGLSDSSRYINIVLSRARKSYYLLFLKCCVFMEYY